MRLALLPDALAELEWEMLCLESERPGWGEMLLEEVADVAELAAEHPQLGERRADVPEELDVRRYPSSDSGSSSSSASSTVSA